MAEDEGFEPPQTESESGVLPLHKSSIFGTDIIIRTIRKKSRSFFLFSHIFSGHSKHSQTDANYASSSQGKGLFFKTLLRRYRNVAFSPSWLSMVSRYSSCRLVSGWIRSRSRLRIK